MGNYTTSGFSYGYGYGYGNNNYFIYAIISWILCRPGMWKIFEKAGKPGWAALIPVYDSIVLVEIVGKPLWWFILLYIPCVNIIFVIWVYNLLSKSFGKTEGFTVGLVFLPYIFVSILGFGDAEYTGPLSLDERFGEDDYQKPFDIDDRE